MEWVGYTMCVYIYIYIGIPWVYKYWGIAPDMSILVEKIMMQWNSTYPIFRQPPEVICFCRIGRGNLMLLDVLICFNISWYGFCSSFSGEFEVYFGAWSVICPEQTIDHRGTSSGASRSNSLWRMVGGLVDGVQQSSLLQPYIYDIICGSEDGIYPLVLVIWYGHWSLVNWLY